MTLVYDYIHFRAIFRSNCFHKKGHEAPCSYSVYPYMIGMGILEIFLSQIPNLHKLSLVSVVAAVMSFGYSSIGMGLAFAQVVSGEFLSTLVIVIKCTNV